MYEVLVVRKTTRFVRVLATWESIIKQTLSFTLSVQQQMPLVLALD